MHLWRQSCGLRKLIYVAIPIPCLQQVWDLCWNPLCTYNTPDLKRTCTAIQLPGTDLFIHRTIQSYLSTVIPNICRIQSCPQDFFLFLVVGIVELGEDINIDHRGQVRTDSNCLRLRDDGNDGYIFQRDEHGARAEWKANHDNLV